MPTYVYKCGNCEHMFEVRQRMADDPLTDCPKCNESALRRVVNNVGIVFKGSGFYVTDNRNGRNSTASSNGSSAAAKEKDSGSESTNESKASTESSKGDTKKVTENQ